MPYRQNFPIPPVINPPKQCLCIEIPGSPEWKAIIAGLLSELQLWFNWERTGDNSGALCAAVWKEVYNSIDWSTMSCCCGEFDIIFQWTVDGVLQSSDDDGETWTDDPKDDPRNSSPIYPPIPEDTPNPKCVGADSAVLLIKEQIGDQLTDGMSRYTLSQLISDWVKTMLQTSNPFEAIVTVLANQIFALVIATLRPALTTGVYDQLRCILYCNMSGDVSFNEAQWEAVRSDILSQITGIAGIFLEHLIFLIGKVGITNLCRSGAGSSDADCSACCPQCGDNWIAYDGYGNPLTFGDDDIGHYIEATPVFHSLAYYIIIHSPGDDNDCCNLVHALNADGTEISDGSVLFIPCGQPKAGTYSLWNGSPTSTNEVQINRDSATVTRIYLE